MTDAERMERFGRAMQAFWDKFDEPKDDWTLRHEVSPDGTRLQFWGVRWIGETLSACLDQAEAWAFKIAANNVRKQREFYDLTIARQRELEKALS